MADGMRAAAPAGVVTRLRRSRAVRNTVRRLGVHRVQRIVGLVQAPVLAALDLALRRLPRDPYLVVLGSPLDRFADNSAYLYLHLSSERGSPLTAVWVTGSPGLVARLRSLGHRAELRWSPAGLRTCLRAGTFTYSGYRSDINRWLSAGAFALCLWHGIPIKRIAEGHEAAGRPRRPRLGGEAAPDALLSSTDYVSRDLLAPAFGVGPERCWELGYPRNDHLLTAPDGPPRGLVDDHAAWERLHPAGPVVGLFLTWRDERSTDVVDADVVRRLADVCGRAGGVLAYKAHFNVSGPAVDSVHCVTLSGDADLNAYLGRCDVLVTDYSSVALDYLLLGRPIVYYMPDREHYARTRGFALDPLSLPGSRTEDVAALLREVARLVQLTAAERAGEAVSNQSLRSRIWGDDPGHSSAAVAAAIAARAAQT